jgi:hypothetical protein
MATPKKAPGTDAERVTRLLKQREIQKFADGQRDVIPEEAPVAVKVPKKWLILDNVRADFAGSGTLLFRKHDVIEDPHTAQAIRNIGAGDKLRVIG